MAVKRGRFEVVRTDAGWHVRIIASNGEPLATSETLADKAAAIDNVDAVIAVVKSAGVKGVQVRIIDERATP